MRYSQKNIEALFQLIGSISGQEYIQTKNFDFINTPDSVWPNQILNFHAEEHHIHMILSSIEEQSAKGEIPNLLMLNPNTDKDYILEALKEKQYKSSRWSAMLMDLNGFQKLKSDSKLKVVLVQNSKELRTWLDIVQTELMGKHALNQTVFQNLLKDKNCFFFLGFDGMKAVATSLLYVNGQSAGIYLVASLQAHRKKGFGKRMTTSCLNQAKVLNCERVDLQATELGRGVYESLGFKFHGDINVFRIEKENLNEA